MELNKVYNMDCLEGMRKIESESVDLIITDPPYGINYSSNSGSEEYKEKLHKHDWDKDFNFAIYYDQIYRVAKNDTFIYVFGRKENIRTMEFLGCERILIWDKGHCGMGNLEDWGIGYELIFLFKKGKPKIIGKRVNGVLPFKPFSGDYKHPTQKPIEIIKFIIEKSCKETGIVLDPFMGSGTTAVSCKQLSRKFIGFEQCEKYCRIIEERLQQQNLKNFFE